MLLPGRLRRIVRQERSQPLGDCGMGENSLAQRRIRQVSNHGGLNNRHQFAPLHAECCESQNFITLCADEHFQKTARFRESPGFQDVSDGHFEQTVANAATLGLGFVQSHPCQYWVGKHAERRQPVSGRADRHRSGCRTQLGNRQRRHG